MAPVERWERRAEVPLLLLAVAFRVAYAWPVINPRVSPDLRGALTVASWTVWALFIVDFATSPTTGVTTCFLTGTTSH